MSVSNRWAVCPEIDEEVHKRDLDPVLVQVCSSVFNLSTDWNTSGAEQLYTVNPATGDIVTEARRRSLLSSNALEFTSRALLGGSTGAAAAANQPVSPFEYFQTQFQQDLAGLGHTAFQPGLVQKQIELAKKWKLCLS